MKRLAQFMKMQRAALIAQTGRKVGLSEEELKYLKRASEIYKFDLVTNMEPGILVNYKELWEKNMPYYKKNQPATAIREHYLPTSSELPETAIGAV